MATCCTLCRVVENLATKERRIYNAHLLSTDSFVVIPAVGPFIPGHIMIVSRGHLPSLAYMGPTDLEEYGSLVRTIKEKSPYSDGESLEAEHGASESESGGTCIAHVHVNLVPGFGFLANMFDGTLPRIDIDDRLESLVPSNAPYIFTRGAGMVRLYKASGVPSQFIRREAFRRMGRDDWDWAVFPHDAVIKKTLQLWGRNGDL